MNSLTRRLSFAILAAPAAASFAITDLPVAQRVEILAPSDALVAAEVVLSRPELDLVYQMSTGRRMSVSSAGNALQMRYGRRTEAILRHDGQGYFVSSDGQFSLAFALDRDGDPHAVRLSLPGNRR